MVTIYALSFPDKSTYVGATKNYTSRKTMHLHLLNSGKSHNPLIQQQFDFWQTVTFSILEVCEDSNSVEAEQKWIRKTHPSRRLNLREASPRNSSRILALEETVEKHDSSSSLIIAKGQKRPAGSKKRKSVVNRTTGEVYASARVAGETLGLNINCIRACALGKPKTYLGNVWQYVGDPERDLSRQPSTTPRKTPVYSNKAKERRATATSAAHSQAVRNVDTGELFTSQTLAADKYGVSNSLIRQAVNGSRKTAAGFRWERLTPKKNGNYRKSSYIGHGAINSRPVKNLDTGDEYENAYQAAEAVGVHRSSIMDALHGRSHTCAGSQWSFVRPKR